MNFTVLLFYRYVPVPQPHAEREALWERCVKLGIKGRVQLGEEGINGTVAGSAEAVRAFRAYMASRPHFADIDYKVDYAPTLPFPKLKVKVRDEIVTLGVPVDLAASAPRLSPEAFTALLERGDVVLFDARNRYESAIGRFMGAVTPDIERFKDLPAALASYAHLKDRTVVTYCTGGIRCEKASALMRQSGFTDVYQLDGGIIKYAQAYPDGAFEGECFVFDERLSVAFTEAPKQLGTCAGCGAATNRYANCGLATCNALRLVCPDCAGGWRACADHVSAVDAVGDSA